MNEITTRDDSTVIATTVTTAIATSREAQEVQAMMVAAKRFPRDQIAARDRILNACQRPGLAAVAVYDYAKGGSSVTGPSIRLAEELARSWGNLQYGVRELEQDEDESTLEAYCWDLETNVRSSKVFHVKHFRHTKRGSYKLEDPREIYENNANNGARRMRACILAVIPGDIVEEAVDQCSETLSARADTSQAAVKKLLAAFAKAGVTQDQVEKRIQRHIDAITPAQVAGLIKIGNSMRDGMSKPDDWFESATPAVESIPLPTQSKSFSDVLMAEMDRLKIPPSKLDKILASVGADTVEAVPAEKQEGLLTFIRGMKS